MAYNEIFIAGALSVSAALGAVYIDHSANRAASEEVRRGLEPVERHILEIRQTQQTILGQQRQLISDSAYIRGAVDQNARMAREVNKKIER